jgi:UDP-2,3-diacylglucosamine pyrophosphatase LpxH
MTTETKSGKRRVELVVISDLHLGTFGCQAKELLQYMKSIRPDTLVLNGDIIDIWQFSKSYWPKAHMQVVKQIVAWAAKGTKVHYITGNHDEMMRKFTGFKLGNLSIENKVVLDLDGKKAWIFHGDVFDVTMQHARWLTKLGSVGYDMLIHLNSACNWTLTRLGKEKISLSKKIKNSVKQAVKFINHFEETCADIAIENKYDYVVCGHIHHPEIKKMTTAHGEVMYLNSGDWVENLTALEYNNGEWSVFSHKEHTFPDKSHDKEDSLEFAGKNELFNNLLKEISQLTSVTS